MKQTPETIVLVNFGCEDIQKFARSIRDRHIYTMVMPYTVPAERVMEEKPVGLILCADAGTPERPGAREKFEALKLPILDLTSGTGTGDVDAAVAFCCQCGCHGSWTMEKFIDEAVADIRRQVGSAKVVLGLSGGVDSSVVAALIHKAIGRQLTCVFVNHGLLRKNEPEEVEDVFTKQFDVDFVHVHAEDRYAALLADVVEPEQKRRIIGSQFWKEFFAVAEELAEGGRPVKYLAQGTIYPDIIESGARKTGGKASTIKSHHNLIPFPEGVHFDLIEPLDHFFKDEVRALGTALGLPDYIVHRQPFPGPGLAIRIIGDVDAEKLNILKNADAIVREELDAYNERLFAETGERNSEHSVWQYFAVLPDIKSVGVMGDERTYARPVILRAVESSDAMTADWARLPYDVLARISGRIVAEVPGVNRVVYDITSKPPATIEWE